ncbi:MAG TPA: histidine kinase [Desulfobulbaceae bacterium]|nr:histidine kinase [Desulfobulbaceae bacterium]
MFALTKIRHKLLFYYTLLYAISLTVGFATVYVIIRDSLQKNIESELQNTTTAVYNLVQTSATVSIKNYLRGVAEKNVEIIADLYEKSQQGLQTEAEAREKAAAILLSQTIGESGYIYCLDSRGIVVVHPQQALIGTDVSDFPFVQDVLDKKRGYLEYDWKNPDEAATRPKALYMLHFEPWDWIIAVSTYRAEFKGLVNVDDFKQSVLDLRFGETGYAFVVNGEGKAVIHPKLEGVNILAEESLPNEYLAEIIRRKNGRMVYPWQNPGETEPRLKLCVFSYIEDYDWIVAAASYHEEFYRPLRTIGTLVLATFLATMILVLTLSYKISNSITRPLQKLMDHFEVAGKGDFSLRMTVPSGDEIGKLARFFNRFMEQLGQYHSDLKQQIQVRQEAENSLRQSEQRYRSVMASAADPIITYDMEGRVTYFNPAFQQVFGWSLTECLGKKMDHFVPQENWPETIVMINAIKDGRILTATETKRFTKSGDIRHVSISGAVLRDHEQRLSGSVVILRDITETKKMTRQLMDIGDNVRQTIGQDLHDDLCPHLIGIGGLASALHATLKENGSEGVGLSGQIVGLIDDAATKARGLSRGLCPVHLVAYGLHSALGQLAEHTEMTARIRCTFNGDDSLNITDNTVATHLYYIVQEAVNNAVKHAGAAAIDISLGEEGDYLHLLITDDGHGIDEKGSGQVDKGMGMQIMKYRVQVIGAFLEIVSSRDKGTTIHIYMRKSEIHTAGETAGTAGAA